MNQNPIPLPLAYREFIGLLAWLMAMTALSIDIMLPALPDVGRAFGLVAENDRQLIVTTYLAGMACGQLLWGHVSDRIGRRLPLLLGLAVYVGASAAAVAAPSFAWLLVARTCQGFGGAAARSIAMAIVRDIFSGRDMARTMSFVMMIFITVPVLAPGLGQALLHFGTWRWTFDALFVAGVVAALWVGLRLPETRQASTRRPLGVGASLVAVLGNRVTFGYGLAAGLMFSSLVAYIACAQQIFVGIYDLGPLFPVAFGIVAGSMAVAGFTNALLVQRLGMRKLAHSALVGFIAVGLALTALCWFGKPPLLATMGLLAASFFLFALMQSNFNAIAMQPMGHVAGMASSLLGASVTATGVAIGSFIGRQFDGTLIPIAAGFAGLGICALLIVQAVEGWRGMFRGE